MRGCHKLALACCMCVARAEGPLIGAEDRQGQMPEPEDKPSFAAEGWQLWFGGCFSKCADGGGAKCGGTLGLSLGEAKGSSSEYLGRPELPMLAEGAVQEGWLAMETAAELANTVRQGGRVGFDIMLATFALPVSRQHSQLQCSL